MGIELIHDLETRLVTEVKSIGAKLDHISSSPEPAAGLGKVAMKLDDIANAINRAPDLSNELKKIAAELAGIRKQIKQSCGRGPQQRQPKPGAAKAS